MLDFTAQMVTNLTLGADDVAVGVATFDDTAVYPIKLGTINDTDVLQDKIKQITYTNGGTATGVALHFVLTHVFVPEGGDRADAKDIMVILTDGISGDRDGTARQAYTYKEKHIKVISVGIGPNTDQGELNDMASMPGYVFNVKNFDKLSAIADTINDLACNKDGSYFFYCSYN